MAVLNVSNQFALVNYGNWYLVVHYHSHPWCLSKFMNVFNVYNWSINTSLSDYEVVNERIFNNPCKTLPKTLGFKCTLNYVTHKILNNKQTLQGHRTSNDYRCSGRQCGT